MVRGVDIPWVGGSIYHGLGVNIPWVGGSIYCISGFFRVWLIFAMFVAVKKRGKFHENNKSCLSLYAIYTFVCISNPNMGI